MKKPIKTNKNSDDLSEPKWSIATLIKLEPLKNKILNPIIADNLHIIADMCDLYTTTPDEAEELYYYITDEYYSYQREVNN